jgi:hypothetical protein
MREPKVVCMDYLKSDKKNALSTVPTITGMQVYKVETPAIMWEYMGKVSVVSAY